MQERSREADESRPPYIDYLHAPGTEPGSDAEGVSPAAMGAEDKHEAVAARRSAMVPLCWVLAFLVSLLVVVTQAERISYSIGRGQQRAALEALGNAQLTSFSQASKRVAEGVVRSVLPIETLDLNGEVRTGQGSGVVVGSDGYVLTNFHVIRGAHSVRVYLPEASPVMAEVVGVDADTDLAVLKVDTGGLLALEWGDSDILESGDPVWAVGSPFGLDNSVTMGIVSAKGRRGIGGRSGQMYQDYLQTDAAVNPGNSGGALVNIRGELVGINTAIVGPAYQGISFAIPSSMAREVYQRLRENNGKFNRGWLGVRLAQMTPEQRRNLDMEVGGGALVVEVVSGSPAERAGLQADDVIVKWQDHAVEDQRDLLWQVAATQPGVEVVVVLQRDGEQKTVTVHIADWPAVLPE